jgi:hypothetical protein
MMPCAGRERQVAHVAGARMWHVWQAIMTLVLYTSRCWLFSQFLVCNQDGA